MTRNVSVPYTIDDVEVFRGTLHVFVGWTVTIPPRNLSLYYIALSTVVGTGNYTPDYCDWRWSCLLLVKKRRSFIISLLFSWVLVCRALFDRYWKSTILRLRKRAWSAWMRPIELWIEIFFFCNYAIAISGKQWIVALGGGVVCQYHSPECTGTGSCIPAVWSKANVSHNSIFDVDVTLTKRTRCLWWVVWDRMWMSSLRMSYVTLLAWVVSPLQNLYWSKQSSHDTHSVR